MSGTAERSAVSVGRRLGAAALGVSGLAIAVGGLLHPHVPAARADQMQALAGNSWWLRSHWTLTLGQPVAALGVLGLADRLSPDRRAPGLWGGAALAAFGLFVGTLGTLAAATGLPTAAEAGDEGVYATVNAFTLGLGWLCVVLTSAGGVLLGARVASFSQAPGGRVVGWIVLGVSASLLASMALLSPSHPWTHDVVLRASAVLAGALLAAIGGWLALGAAGGPSPG